MPGHLESYACGKRSLNDGSELRESCEIRAAVSLFCATGAGAECALVLLSRLEVALFGGELCGRSGGCGAARNAILRAIVCAGSARPCDPIGRAVAICAASAGGPEFAV